LNAPSQRHHNSRSVDLSFGQPLLPPQCVRTEARLSRNAPSSTVRLPSWERLGAIRAALRQGPPALRRLQGSVITARPLVARPHNPCDIGRTWRHRSLRLLAGDQWILRNRTLGFDLQTDLALSVFGPPSQAAARHRPQRMVDTHQSHRDRLHFSDLLVLSPWRFRDKLLGAAGRGPLTCRVRLGVLDL